VHEAHRDGRWQPDPLILDDQALVARVRGRGLVVITGCGHSGIVNILQNSVGTRFRFGAA
jgi:7,8-dihydropterin-6-yl-methyl-4-(beta-D-ribofuranosyl)aminobenzene 5'-phosphate synthase